MVENKSAKLSLSCCMLRGKLEAAFMMGTEILSIDVS